MSRRRKQRQRPTVNSKAAPSAGVIQTNASQQVIRMFQQAAQSDQKHDNYYDFGYPDHLTFHHYHRMYKRNGFARAGVTHAINKTWREYPDIAESTTEPHDETTNERNVREMFDRVNLWQRLREVDERSRVGDYAGVVLRFADGKALDQPVDRVPGGVEGLVDVIPAWEGQLEPASYDTDPMSTRYGQPTMYLFNESAVDPDDRKTRAARVHPDRVHVWSRDGSIYGNSVLEAGFNDLITLEKIIGSGGEGFWKNAKSAPVLNMDKDANPASLAAMLGVDVSDIADKLDEVVAGWQKGFDQLLMFQGMEAKTLGVDLPQPAEFVLAPLQSFAASINEPLKILVGSQSGERASTEDAKEWDSTIMSRRENYVKPNIRRLIERLVQFGVMPRVDWVIDWTDLTEDSMDEKIARADKMADVNRKLLGTGERAFTGDEIREVVGLEPLGESDVLPEDEEDSDDE